jgi:hypothetical protein
MVLLENGNSSRMQWRAVLRAARLSERIAVMGFKMFVADLSPSAEKLLPCYLAAFNLANTKRRNLHLGWRRVDEDISIFDALLHDTFKLEETIVKRVGGNEWVVFLHEKELPLLDKVILAYSEEIAHRAGWKCRGRSPSGEVRTIEKTSKVILVRAVRCGLFRIRGIQELTVLADQDLWPSQAVPPNKITLLDPGAKITRQPWTCVKGAIPADEYCPFCNGTAFKNDDGDDGGYSALCTSCSAELEILWL